MIPSLHGERLGAYRVDRELGSGGMGKVYSATVEGRAPGLSEGERVALKVVHPHLLETDGFFLRFMREAQLGASIRHENVVRTYMADAMSSGGRQQNFLVMEYVEGQTLRGLLAELGTVPEELCRHVGREICRGLAAIHGAGAIHRDMKPENVLITVEHVVKVMDLGVARLADEQMRISQTGAFVGSPEYASPEQFGGEVDHRCDLHALGLILYEIATAQHPYRADDFRGVMRRVIDEPPRRLGTINPQLSAFYEEVVHTLLAKKREERFGSAGELLAILEEGEDSAWWRERARRLQATTRRPLRRIRIPRETAVYGREKEIERLLELFAHAKDGDGRVVLIEGEAGIGKSRLIDELLSRLQARGEDVNFLFGSYPPGGAATASGAFTAAYREHFGEAGCAEYLTRSPSLVPAFDALLRGEIVTGSAVPLTKESLQTCFVHATRALAEERTTVVHIDDLHFAPDEGRALFTSLAMAVPGSRVLLVGTTRPGVSGEWVAGLTRLEQTTQMEVQRLGPKDLIALLKDSLKSADLALALSGQIAVKSDGNPFFAFEIIRGLREGRFITQSEDGTWVSTRAIDRIEIPSSVLDLVNARIADLTEDERNALDVGACLGFEFDPLLVGAVLEIKQIPLMRMLAQIEKKHRLVRSAGRVFRFDHHQVQEALYAAMPDLLREPYHAALAEALEVRSGAADRDPATLDGALCVDLADHFLKGGRGGNSLRYLVAAQEHLARGYLHGQVVALGDRALAVPGLLSGIDRAEVLLRMAKALHRRGEIARQLECAQEAEVLAGAAGDDPVQAEALKEVAWALQSSSRFVESETTFRRALDWARARGDRMAEQDVRAGLSVALLQTGRVEEAQEHGERALALSRELGDLEGEAGASINLGSSYTLGGRFPEAQASFDHGITICREIGHREFEGAGAGNLGRLCARLGRLSEAQAHFERCAVLCRESGYRGGEAGTHLNLAAVLLTLGRASAALGHAEGALVMFRGMGYRFAEAIAIFNLGRVADEEGRAQDAQRLLQQALDIYREIDNGEGVAMGLLAIGDLAVVADDRVAARTAFEEALSVARERKDLGQCARLTARLACLPGGDAAAALDAFHEAGERATAEDCREARFFLWKATGDRTHIEEAKRLLDELVAHAPVEDHESMLQNVRLHREILAAWTGGSVSPAGHPYIAPAGGESITRVES